MKKLVLLILVILSITLATAIPQYLDNQGVLRNSSTGELLTGTYRFNVTLFNVTNDAYIYSENTTLDLSNGVYNYIIGRYSPILKSYFENDLYIKLKVNSDIMDGYNFTSVPYAFRSLTCNDSDHLDGLPASSYFGGGSGNNTVMDIIANGSVPFTNEVQGNFTTHIHNYNHPNLMNGSNANFTTLEVWGQPKFYLSTTEDFTIYDENGTYPFLNFDNVNTDAIPNGRIQLYRNGTITGYIQAGTTGVFMNTIAAYDYAVGGVTKVSMDSTGNWNVPYAGDRNILYQTGNSYTQNLSAIGITLRYDNKMITSWDEVNGSAQQPYMSDFWNKTAENNTVMYICGNGSLQFVNQLPINIDNSSIIRNGSTAFWMSTSTGDKISFFDNRLSGTSMYGLGMASNVLYYKAASSIPIGGHEWYINNNRDGKSFLMRLSRDGMLNITQNATVIGNLTVSGGIDGLLDWADLENVPADLADGDDTSSIYISDYWNMSSVLLGWTNLTNIPKLGNSSTEVAHMIANTTLIRNNTFEEYTYLKNITTPAIRMTQDTANHVIDDNATCIIIRGDTSELHIC